MHITPEHEDNVQTDSLNGIAKLAVEIVGKHFFEVHRGAMRWLGFDIAFGNDGYRQQESTRKEVELFLRYLDSVSIRPLTFATSADGYSWLILLDADRDWDEGPSIDELDDAVWLCHWISGLDTAESARKIRGFDAELVSSVVEAVWPTETPKSISPHLRLFMDADTAPQVAAERGNDIGGPCDD
jgi:hypothetical protein